MQHSDLVRVRTTKEKGRGVYARKAIKKGATIEKVPLLFLPMDTFVNGRDNKHLNMYFFLWSEKTVAVSLGFGSLYNHSYEPNARYEYGKKTLRYLALRDIEKGEEILINYNYLPDSKDPMIFDVK